MAAFNRCDPADFPDLDVAMGRRSAHQAQPQSPEMMAHNLRLWRGVLNRGSSNPPASP